MSLFIYKDESLNDNDSIRLQEVYDLFGDEDVKFLSKNDCLRISLPKNQCYYVLMKFEGAVFEHLRSIKSNIISIHCVLLHYSQNKPFPKPINAKCPLYSLAMSNMIVCCTNIEKTQRARVYDRVKMMNGEVSETFTERVTHLVTSEVGSKKYQAAVTLKCKIMLPEWVDEVWKMSAERELHADETQFLKYKCPLFKNFTICASGITSAQKEEIKRLVESNGGSYNGTFNVEYTTHLVTDEAKGEKYKSAKHHNIFIVGTKWIYDSCAASYCLSVRDYPVGDSVSDSTSAQTSTPSDLKRVVKRIPREEIDLSVIADRSHANIRNIVNDTETSTLLSQSSNPHNISHSMSQGTRDLLKELNSITKVKSTLFDGFGIYCENIENSGINEKLKKLCNSGGAVRFEEFNSDVTHVIVNQVNEKKCKFYVDSNPEINILSIDWLIESCKSNEIKDYKDYCVFKNALNSVKTPKKRAREPTSTSNNSSTASNNSTFKLYENEINQCLAQYIVAPNFLNNKKTPAKTAHTTPILHESNSNVTRDTSANTSLASIKVANKCGAGVFLSKKFKIYGFDESEKHEWKSLIEANGGSLDDENQNIDDNDECDYIVAPLTITEQVNKALTQQVITPYWIKKSIEASRLVLLHENVLYQSIPRFNSDQPLSSCVITISGYTHYEKDAINSLCKLIGAQTQASFSLTSKNGILQNTHLICKTAEGPKFKAAVKWGLPAVRVEWLLESVATGYKADEAKYCVQDENFKTSEFIESLNRIRNSHLLSTQLTNCDHEDTTQQQQDEISTTMRLESGNDSSLSLNTTDCKKRRLNNDENYNQNDEENLKMSTPAVFKTPQPINPRLKELRKSNITPSTPNNQTIGSNSSSNWSTPLFMDPKKFNGEYKVKNVDWNLVNELLKTPHDAQTASKAETPMQDLFDKALKACKKASETDAFYTETESPDIYLKKLQRAQQFYNADEDFDENDEDNEQRIQPTPQEQRELKLILKNVKIYVTKKLAKQQAELNQLVENLGGEFVWIYNQSVTHVIFSGKLNDPNKEMKLAREQNKFIVSPNWLYACCEQKARLDETQFPYTYNPSKGAVVTSRTPRVSRTLPQHQSPAIIQTQRSQLAKTDPKKLIENFDSSDDNDEETYENNGKHKQEEFEINSKLLKKKQTSSHVNTNTEDSDMNFVDSQMLKNCDKVTTNVIPDSIDIRCNFLDQLQDKLSTIKNNTSGTTVNSANHTPTIDAKAHRSRYRSDNYEIDTINDDPQQQQQQLPQQDGDLLIHVRHNSVVLLAETSSKSSNDESTNGRQYQHKSLNSKHKSFDKHRRDSSVQDEEQQHHQNEHETISNAHHALPSQIQITRWKDDDSHATKRKNDTLMHKFSNLNKN